MKKIFIFTLIIISLILVSCKDGDSSEVSSVLSENTVSETEQVVTDQIVTEIVQAETTVSTNEDTMPIVMNGKTDYVLYRSESAKETERKAATRLKKSITDTFGCDSLSIKSDFVKKGTDMNEYRNLNEILVGNTNRLETVEALEKIKDDEFIVKVIDNKLILVGKTDKATFQAVCWFTRNYISEKSDLTVPKTLEFISKIDYAYCEDFDMTYNEIASEVYASFKKYCIKAGQFITSFSNADFWDNAEMFETLVDAYEATGSEEYLKDIKSAANYIVSTRKTNWSYNMYNDDIMWMCIAFARAGILTDNKDYISYAKSNFDTVYKRACDETIGGGLWWKQDEKVGKNSCVNCPAAIAACYLGKALDDDSYYEKAKNIMDWEIKTLFNKNTGAVEDSIITSLKVSNYHSTYNQGTFIGACTLLHEKYKDDIYLEYAKKSAEFAINNMTSNGILDNGEAPLDNGDLIGFKGIFTRWLYRYGKYVNNIGILEFLQNNAKTAYSHKNSKGLIWTDWKLKTKDDFSKYDVYGLSTAVALMFNSLPWDK